MKRECETCIKRKTTYCPTSMECMATDDMSYYQNRIMLLEENQELKKQLEKKYSKIGTLTNEVLYEENTKLINQQKEFIEWLEAMNRMYQNEYKDIDTAEHYNCVLQKYKSIIGDDK